MDRPQDDKQDIGERDLENDRPGFTPAGRPKSGADGVASTSDREQPSALGGKVATRSKVKQSN